MANKKDLLLKLDQLSFSLDDLHLYLDTHPEDPDALALYQELRSERAKAIKDFETNFYPLTKDSEDIIKNSKWAWGDAPLPWEVDANVEL